MLSLLQIIALALKSTSRKFGWWILAFLQFVFLVAFIKSLFSLTNGTFLGLLCLLGFSAVSCTLWLEISAFFQKIKNKMTVREFFSISINFALIFLVFFALAMTLRQFGLPTAVLEVLISIIFATLIILLLNLVVFKIKFLNAFSISLDTWKKLPYLGMSLSFSVFILFSACVFLGQQVLASYFLGEFSVFKASATIWIFGLGSVVVLSFVLALFNCFWVLCVLEKIRPLKTKELDKTEISVAVSKPAI